MIKKIFSVFFVTVFFMLPVFCSEMENFSEQENSPSELQNDESNVKSVPDKKRPVKIPQEKIDELNLAFPENIKEHQDTLAYGMEDDIIELLNTLQKNDDVRFVDELYDLFQTTKNPVIREKILDYFGNLKDPCLEDFAVTILNDPYDEKKSTVDCVFRYVQNVKTKEALPAVLALIEKEEESYFNSAIVCLGELGGKDEAVYLAGFLDREDLTLSQKQQVVKVLGKIKAVETFDKLVELAEDEDENSFIRMYSAEAIGAMEKEEAVEVLVKLYEDSDPKLRCYVVKGLAFFPENEEAKKTVVEAVRDSHVSVRLEAVDACKNNGFKEAVPFIIYRLEKDKEDSVKKKSYPALAVLNTKEGNEYLVKQITDKKTSDTVKIRCAQALLEFSDSKTGLSEIIELARETLKDDRRKNLRYALGKEFAKYKNDEFASICAEYIDSKDTATQGTGLDIFARGRYPQVLEKVQKIVMDDAKAGTKKNANAQKAERILGEDDSSVVEAKKIREEKELKKEAEKKGKNEKKDAK